MVYIVFDILVLYYIFMVFFRTFFLEGTFFFVFTIAFVTPLCNAHRAGHVCKFSTHSQVLLQYCPSETMARPDPAGSYNLVTGFFFSFVNGLITVSFEQ